MRRFISADQYPETECDKISDLLSIVLHLKQQNALQHAWFRAQLQAWPLTPSALRPSCTPPVPISSIHAREQHLARRARQRLTTHISIPPTDHTVWLTAIQHHGIPSRLLDWTESLPVALHFLRDAKDTDDFCIFMLDPVQLNFLSSKSTVDGVLDHDYEFIKQQCSRAFGEGQAPYDWPLVFYPRHVYARLIAKSSCFTVHGRSDDPIDGQLPKRGANASDVLRKFKFRLTPRPPFYKS